MSQYTLPRVGAEELERERLTLLERIHDPLTLRQLDRIGVREGWHCLDVGAGAGSVTRMLADRVGDTGSVVATDLDPRLLEPLAGPTVRVLQHDLLSDPLPESAFDLVHARLLLMHLPSRVDAIRRLLASVRVGGWLAIVDTDFASVRVEPVSAAWKRAWSAFLDAAVAASWDPRYGARLEEDVESLEVEVVEAEQSTHRGPGGSSQADLLSLTLERLRPRMLAVGAADEDIDEGRKLLADRSTRFTAPTKVTVSARRPG